MTDTPDPQGAAAERTPTDYALEFAEYLAQDAERLLEAMNAEDALRLRREESDDVSDDDMHDAGADRVEHVRAVRNGIYEFRKRRDRATQAPAATPAPLSQQPKDLGDAFGPGSTLQASPSTAIPIAAGQVPSASELLAIAIAHLAEWCHAIDKNGTGWDDWDEHYKDAAYRPGPLRELIDAELAELRKRDKEDQ